MKINWSLKKEDWTKSEKECENFFKDLETKYSSDSKRLNEKDLIDIGMCIMDCIVNISYEISYINKNDSNSIKENELVDSCSEFFKYILNKYASIDCSIDAWKLKVIGNMLLENIIIKCEEYGFNNIFQIKTEEN